MYPAELSAELPPSFWFGYIMGFVLTTYCIYGVLKKIVGSLCKRELTKMEKNILAILVVGFLFLLFVMREI